MRFIIRVVVNAFALWVVTLIPVLQVKIRAFPPGETLQLVLTLLAVAAITGQASSVSVLDAMEILGPDLTRFRLRQAVELLGAPSKKETKEWEKLLAELG